MAGDWSLVFLVFNVSWYNFFNGLSFLFSRNFKSMNVQKENLYQCFECGLKYKEKEWADKYQAQCVKYKSCNLEIIKHALGIKNKN